MTSSVDTVFCASEIGYLRVLSKKPPVCTPDCQNYLRSAKISVDSYKEYNQKVTKNTDTLFYESEIS